MKNWIPALTKYIQWMVLHFLIFFLNFLILAQLFFDKHTHAASVFQRGSQRLSPSQCFNPEAPEQYETTLSERGHQYPSWLPPESFGAWSHQKPLGWWGAKHLLFSGHKLSKIAKTPMPFSQSNDIHLNLHYKIIPTYNVKAKSEKTDQSGCPKKIDKRQPVATKCAKIQKHMAHPGTSVSYLSSERMDCKSLLQSAMNFPSMAVCFLEPASSALSWRIQKSPTLLAILGFQISHRAPKSIQNSAEAKSIRKITPQDDQNARGMCKNPGDEAGIELPLMPSVSLLNNSVSPTTSHAKPWLTTRTPWPGTTVPLQTHEGRKQLRRSSSQNPREVSRATFSVRLSITFHIYNILSFFMYIM